MTLRLLSLELSGRIQRKTGVDGLSIKEQTVGSTRTL